MPAPIYMPRRQPSPWEQFLPQMLMNRYMKQMAQQQWEERQGIREKSAKATEARRRAYQNKVRQQNRAFQLAKGGYQQVEPGQKPSLTVGGKGYRRRPVEVTGIPGMPRAKLVNIPGRGRQLVRPEKPEKVWVTHKKSGYERKVFPKKADALVNKIRSHVYGTAGKGTKAGNKKLDNLSDKYFKQAGRFYSAKRGVGQYIQNQNRQQVAEEARGSMRTLAVQYVKAGGDARDLGISPEDIREDYENKALTKEEADYLLKELFGEEGGSGAFGGGVKDYVFKGGRLHPVE